MSSTNTMTSVLADAEAVAMVMPIACPCEFGPRYHLEELLSIGPRAWVYRGVDRPLSEAGHAAEVAVKICRHPGRVEEESLLCRRVVHRNVVRVLDRGIGPDGRAFVVSEFVRGASLSAVGGPWAPERAAAVVCAVARGVQAAHDKGVVHCDIKPSNVLLGDDGDPKLADFDVAAREACDAAERRGTLAFMAPEQHAREPGSITPAVDVYGLGGLLYHLLTGLLPNGQTPEDAHAVLAAKRERVWPQARGDVWQVCRKALAFDRAERYRSAGELADDLTRVLEHRPLEWVHTLPHRRLGLWCRRRPAAAIATIAILLSILGIAIGAVWWERNERDRKIRAYEEANRITKQELEEVKQRARGQIKSFAEIVKVASDNTEIVLPALALVELVTEVPALVGDGVVASGPERLALLEWLIQRAEEKNQDLSIETLVHRYAAARIALSLGKNEQSEREFRRVLSHSAVGTPETDLFARRAQALLFCAVARQPGHPEQESAIRSIRLLLESPDVVELGTTITQFLVETLRNAVVLERPADK